MPDFFKEVTVCHACYTENNSSHDIYCLSCYVFLHCVKNSVLNYSGLIQSQ